MKNVNVNEKEMQNKRKANERPLSCAAAKWHDGHLHFVSADAIFQIIYGKERSKAEGDERMKETASFVDSTMVIFTAINQAVRCDTTHSRTCSKL